MFSLTLRNKDLDAEEVHHHLSYLIVFLFIPNGYTPWMTLVELGGAKVGWLLNAVDNVRRCKQAEERYEMPRLNIIFETAVCPIYCSAVDPFN